MSQGRHRAARGRHRAKKTSFARQSKTRIFSTSAFVAAVSTAGVSYSANSAMFSSKEADSYATGHINLTQSIAAGAAGSTGTIKSIDIANGVALSVAGPTQQHRTEAQQSSGQAAGLESPAHSNGQDSRNGLGKLLDPALEILPAPSPKHTARPPRTEPKSGDGVWDRLAQCESSGNWSEGSDTGIGPFTGGLQFHPATWQDFGGHTYAPTADQATKEEQIIVAKRVQAQQGWGAWPVCSKKLGLR